MELSISPLLSPVLRGTVEESSEILVARISSFLSSISHREREKYVSVGHIVYFPIIVDPMMVTIPDKITYKRNENAVYIKNNINFLEWLNGTKARRVSLLEDGLASGFRLISDRRLVPEAKEMLLSVLRPN